MGGALNLFWCISLNSFLQSCKHCLIWNLWIHFTYVTIWNDFELNWTVHTNPIRDITGREHIILLCKKTNNGIIKKKKTKIKRKCPYCSYHFKHHLTAAKYSGDLGACCWRGKSWLLRYVMYWPQPGLKNTLQNVGC